MNECNQYQIISRAFFFGRETLQNESNEHARRILNQNNQINSILSTQWFAAGPLKMHDEQ